MILGIDVTHPGSSSLKNAPSIAAVVGSVNSEFSQWPASLRANPVAEKDKNDKQSMERVVDLAVMVLERLRCYEKRNGTAPSRLLVYRDGLSEGQFDTCATQEYQSIQAGRQMFLDEFKKKHGYRPIDPPITLICCVKRHHTRLYPRSGGVEDKDYQKWMDQNGNPTPGTLVRERITYGFGEDFFLVSQKSVKGTARPIHYRMLQNEDKSVKARHACAASHYLCYLYGRATRSVGLCTPAYYADLAADRAREYVREFYCVQRNPDGSQRPFDTQTHQQEFEQRLQLHNSYKDSMFYI